MCDDYKKNIIIFNKVNDVLKKKKLVKVEKISKRSFFIKKTNDNFYWKLANLDYMLYVSDIYENKRFYEKDSLGLNNFKKNLYAIYNKNALKIYEEEEKKKENWINKQIIDNKCKNKSNDNKFKKFLNNYLKNKSKNNLQKKLGNLLKQKYNNE